ncbi:hypothetical protein Tcan_15942 [Toxocara canis]|uniref:Uncharacterized protein n=1 Tax=Toxocara canis TaxID=6265 RepID=A0A0B2VGE4_TOXCA|nr:hypothetical protein Tcan_15942 [Toxocara canis]
MNRYGQIRESRHSPFFLAKYTLLTICAHSLSSICDHLQKKGTALNTTQVNRIMNGVEIFNATVVCALTVAAILITALAFFILVHYHGMTVPRGVQKKLLISLFLYCIPLNILNAPNSVDSFLLIIASMNPANEATLSNYYPSNSFVESYCNRVRTIVISLCTLLVIPSYRASLLSMFVHSSRNTRIVQPETSHTVNKRAPVYVYTLSMNLPRQSAVESRAIGRHI